MHKIYTLGFIFFSILLSITSSVHSAELIWSETSNTGSTIYKSEYKNATLVQKIVVVQNGNLNILPAISTAKNGSTMIVWSRITDEGSVLDYIYTPEKGQKVTGTFKTQLATNLAPVIIHDTNNIPWLFWSANNGKDDNIFFSRFIANTWENATQVNSENNVPDILPVAGTTADGLIWVSWQQLNNNSYIELTTTFKKTSSSNNSAYQQTKESMISPLNSFSSDGTAEITLPQQINTDGRIIHFSRNGDVSSSKSIK